MRDSGSTQGVITRSAQRNNAMVDLFHGWSTDAQPSDDIASTSAVVLENNALKRTASQEASLWTSEEAAPQFQSITFPKKDSSLAVSLYTGFKEDQEVAEEAELERIRRLPPSKRPGVSHAKKTPPNHIKRPRNAYIIFRSHTVSQKLIPKEVENDHRNISRIIAHMWKSLTPEDRAHYEQIAKEEKERHKQLFPNYRYQPATRRTGVSKRNVKKLENGEEECQEIADIILKAQGKDGVIVRSGPSKAVKRAREATRASSAAARRADKASTPRAKRVRVAKSETDESDAVTSAAAGEVLETVFLHPSPSSSPMTDPSSGSSHEAGSLPTPSPEPFQLASRTTSVDYGQLAQSPDHTIKIASDIFGRRSSSVPVTRACSPPPSFLSAVREHTAVTALGSDHNELIEVEHTEVEDGDHFSMPAPAWKGRKTLPPAPIANTWQFASYDDQSLPSPRSFESFASASKAASARPRTAWPSTPSSSSFRGFFHPWAVEHGNESMLISPMTASFQDLRRRSSLARAGSIAGRRQDSFGTEAPYASGEREEDADVAQATLTSASDVRLGDAPLFDEVARTSAVSLEPEASTTDYVDSRGFAFDPALEGEGCEPAAAESVAEQQELPSRSQATQPVLPFPRFYAESPRASFSGSTLAAAARDWASMKRRRSRMAPPPVVNADNEAVPQPAEMPASGDTDSIESSDHRNANKSSRYRSSLEESVERAVMLALGKEHNQDSDRGERNSKIVEQILSSLSTELAFQQQHQQSDHHHHQQQQQMMAPPSMYATDEAASSFIGSRSRSSSRASRTHYYASNTASADGSSLRTSKPLPSPLQLVVSNHEMGSDAVHSHPHSHAYSHSPSYSYSQSTSQHCV
ncbi:hypothetical protein PHSY_001046 [Pseudozyma hubeiensis SY62]|uniref:HMG box domain-containing protein n=1 Tax=Pseudozyma hubeiensis (strain SY62) TaxID=1305764 RepID=R9NXY0_PSEHS|nr:hypothetical protein PHSY_001046 [Pseudozyma hubeiensis SY62]GAC93481.1 hypothetical protein PHSY_001046 [Pseudozyma hubeiensis SY62]